MVTTAVFIYVIVGYFNHYLWPIELLRGKLGLKGYVLLIGWLILLIAGIFS
jgi:hypothetical protein